MKFLMPACLAAALAIPTGASALTHVVIDFDALNSNINVGSEPNPQTVPLTEFSEDGFTFGLSFTGSNNGPAIFDVTCPASYGSNCNGDRDLQPDPTKDDGGEVSGNVLILQQDDGSTAPNDDANGGSITFTVTEGQPFKLLGFSAVDDGIFEMFVGNTLLGTVNNGPGAINDGRFAKAEFDSMLLGIPLLGVNDTFRLEYSGSGGIDSIKLGVIPLPATFLLMLTALGGLGFVARRRVTSAV